MEDRIFVATSGLTFGVFFLSANHVEDLMTEKYEKSWQFKDVPQLHPPGNKAL